MDMQETLYLLRDQERIDAAFRDMFAALRHFSFPGELPANLMCSKFEGRQTWHVEIQGRHHLVWDNGGEVGVEHLNAGKLPEFFPFHGVSMGWLDPWTMAYRLRQLLCGEPIDYAEDYREFHEQFPQLVRKGV